MQLPFTGRAEQLAQIEHLMAVKEGAFFVVTGHAGIGKSTLLRHIAELYPQQGQVFIDISDIPPLQTAVEFLQHFAKCAQGLKHTEVALAKIKGTYKTAEDLIAPYKTLLGETAKLGYENAGLELSKDEQSKLTKVVSSVLQLSSIYRKNKQEREKIAIGDPELYLLKALQADCKKQPLIFIDTFERLQAVQVVSQQKIGSFYSKLHQNLTPVKADLNFSDWLERFLEFLKAHGAMVVIAGREVSHWRACSQALKRFTDEDIADLVGCSDYADLQALVANEQTRLALVSLLNRLSFGGIPLWLQLALNFVSLELANGRDVITLAAMKNIDELFATPVCEQDLASANIENASCKLALFKRVMQHNLELEDEAWKMALPRRLDKPVLQILFAERADTIREAFTKAGLLPAERWVKGTTVYLHEEIRDLLLAYATYKQLYCYENTLTLHKKLAEYFEQQASSDERHLPDASYHYLHSATLQFMDYDISVSYFWNLLSWSLALNRQDKHTICVKAHLLSQFQASGLIEIFEEERTKFRNVVYDTAYILPMYEMFTGDTVIYDFAGLENYLINFLDVNPNYGEVWFGLAEQLRCAKRFGEAVNAYKKQIEITPNHENAWYGLGLALKQQGKLEEAVSAYKKQIEITPNHEYVWNGLGNALKQQGKLEEAASAYKKQFEINPKHQYASDNLGDVLRQPDKLEDAVNAYKKQIEITPNHEWAWSLLGNVLKKQGKLEEAVNAYKKQIDIKPNHEQAWNGLGNALKQQGKLEEAVNAYKKQIEITPNHEDAWDDLGCALYQQGKLEEAVNAYNKQIEIKPNHKYAWNGLGNALYDQGKLEEAVNAYNKQIEINPNHGWAWNRLGIALIQQGKLEKAVNVFNKQIDINPNHENAWNGLGLALRRQGKLEEAVNAYKKQIEIKPDHESVWGNLGYAYWKQGNLTKTQESFAKALEINPQNISALSNDAELGLVQNDKARCLQRIASATTLIDNKSDIYVIFPFLAWLVEPENSPAALYTAISELDKSVKITWDFSEIEPAILRLNPEHQRLARQFIAYFEGIGELPRV